MSMSMNRVFLAGNLTRDPETRFTSSGVAVTNLGLAVNRRYTTKEGEKKEDTVFVTVVAWGKQAENCQEYLRKGSPVMVEGRLSYRTWETPEKEKRSALEVTADRVNFLGRRSEEGGVVSDDENEFQPS